MVINFRRSITIVELWRPEVERRLKIVKFFRLCRKTTPYREIFKRLFQGFTATPIAVLCSNFVKFGWREIGKIVHCLPDKKNKISPGSPAVATARIAPKIYQGQLPRMHSESSRFHPNRLTFGGVIPERMNTIKTGREVFPIFCWSLASTRAE